MSDALFRALPWAAVLVDAEGRVVDTNRAAEALDLVGPTIGEPVEHVLAQSGWRGRVHLPEGSAAPPSPEGHPPSGALLRSYPDGRLRRVDVRCARIESTAAERVLVVFHEAQDQRPLDNGGDRDQRDYRLLFEHAPDAVLVTRPDGTILDANPAACRLFGRSKDEVRAVGRSGVLVQDAALERALRERARTGRALAELTFIRKDGTQFPGEMTSVVLPGTQPSQAFVIVRDVSARKAQEAALRERTDYIDAILENAPIGFAVNTIDDGVARFVSRRFEEIYGVPAGSLRSVDDYFERVFRDPFFRRQIRERITRDMASGDAARMRWEAMPVVDAGGNTRYLTAINIPLLDQNLMVSTVQDVTRQVVAEGAARQRAEDMDRFFDLASDLLCIADTQGHLTRLSREWTATLGWTPEELTGRPFMDFVHPDDVEATRRATATLASRGRMTRFVNRYRCQDGSYRWLEWRSVAPEGRTIYAVARDVTDQRRDEEALRESERRFKSVIETASEAIFVQTNHRFAYVNAATLQLFGATRAEQLIGQPVIERFHPAYRDGVMARIRALNDERRAVPLLEEVCLRLDGTTVTAEVSAAPIEYEGAAGAVVFARDVTERRRLEAQLVQAQRMESIGRLAGGVAHDFNNMLSVIMGHAELCLAMQPSGPAQDGLEEILRAARRSADLTRQLLAFARKQTIRPQVLDLNECVRGTLKMLERLVGEDVEILVRPGEDLWPVSLDSSQFDQILANLVVNARDAMPRGGHLVLETRNQVVDEAFMTRHSGAGPGDYVCLAVGDTGTGMSADVLSQVFEPFFTTKRLGEGTGLGLSTVHGIMAQHGGFVDVYSEVGVGTTFKLWFPRHVGVPRGWEAAGAQPVPRGDETILLVEDEASVRELGRTALTTLGYRVVPAPDAATVLAMPPGELEEVDLLVTDVVMPGMNGKDLAARLQSVRPSLKCLFMSGYTADFVAHRGILDDRVRLLQKPFSLRALAVAVRRALDD